MKTVLAILSCVGTIGTCHGQGTVNWAIITPAALTAQTNAAQYSPIFGGGTGFGPVGDTAPASSGLVYYFELLYNTSFTGSQMPTPDFATLLAEPAHDTGLTATNSNIAGRLAPVNGNTAAVVPWASGATNNIMLVGWSANLGTDWLTVSNTLASWNSSFPYIGPDVAYFGESATGYLNSRP